MNTAISGAIWILAAALIPLAAQGAETPPAGINTHFSWCNHPKTDADKLKRYEGFWKLNLPESPDEYNDDLHIRLVRKCAYRLADLYAAKGNAKDARKMIRWLEANDDSIKITE